MRDNPKEVINAKFDKQSRVGLDKSHLKRESPKINVFAELTAARSEGGVWLL